MSKRRRNLIIVGALLVAAGAALQIPVGGGAVATPGGKEGRVSGMDLSAFSQARPEDGLRLLFIHHSCGGQLMAAVGPDKQTASKCIYESHPNGGNLRALLEADGYQVGEASYGSKIGERTDIFDWLPKFKNDMAAVLATRLQDEPWPNGQQNQIVVWKSCYTENELAADGSAPGNPAGPEITLWNSKATLMAVRAELEKHPEVLFVYVTSPPIAPKVPAEPAWKWLAKKVLGKPHSKEVAAARAARARALASWAKRPDGWLAGYPHKNIVVFDYYDALTDEGASNLSRYPTGDGLDSHPSKVGNAKAAAAFVPFLNRAVRYAGLIGQVAVAEPPVAPAGEAGATPQ